MNDKLAKRIRALTTQASPPKLIKAQSDGGKIGDAWMDSIKIWLTSEEIKKAHRAAHAKAKPMESEASLLAENEWMKELLIKKQSWTK